LYDEDQRINGICFVIPVNGNDLAFKLPARIPECEKVLISNMGPRTRPETKKKIPQQTERAAWKILSDRVEAQMAMIELSQIEITEVFLSYLYDHRTDKTFFEKLKVKGFGNLLEYNE